MLLWYSYRDFKLLKAIKLQYTNKKIIYLLIFSGTWQPCGIFYTHIHCLHRTHWHSHAHTQTVSERHFFNGGFFALARALLVPSPALLLCRRHIAQLCMFIPFQFVYSAVVWSLTCPLLLFVLLRLLLLLLLCLCKLFLVGSWGLITDWHVVRL